MAAIGVPDAAAALSGCADIAEEFSILKKTYLRQVLITHPDKGGDAETFQATRKAFEVIRKLFESGSVASFANSAERPTTSAYTTAGSTTGAGVPSWEFYAAAADEQVPRHHVELARSNRSKCKAVGIAKHCDDASIEKGVIRVGSMDPEAGSYGRWVHLACWRVPSKVWLGLPDPTKCKDVSAFEEALARMGGVQLSGVGDMLPAARALFAQHVMDKSNWARLVKRKAKPEDPAPEGAASVEAIEAGAAGGGAPSQSRKKMKTEAGSVVASTTSTALVTTSEEPSKFIVPVAGKGSAVATSMAGQTVVLTGLFPELGGGAGLSLGKAKAKALVESFGGRVTSSVSGKTTLLLVGKQPGASKVTQASGKGVQMMGLRDLADGLKVGMLKSAEELGPMQIESFSAGYRGNGVGLSLTAPQQEALRIQQLESSKALLASRRALPAPAKRKWT